MNTQRLNYKAAAAALIALCTAVTLLSGCSDSNNNATTNGSNTSAGTAAGTTTEAGTSTTSPSDQENAATGQQSNQDQTGLPEGVTVKRVIKNVTINNGYKKQVELLSDGGKRITVSAPDGTRTVQFIEYEGVITAVNDKTLTIKVEQGTEKTITIPDTVPVEDDDAVGFKAGVEIEWTIDDKGQIESVELDQD